MAAADGELRVNLAVLNRELRKPSHGVCDLWRFKVGLARTGCQLLLHVREFVDAIDKVKLKPLIEEFTERNRLEVTPASYPSLPLPPSFPPSLLRLLLTFCLVPMTRGSSRQGGSLTRTKRSVRRRRLRSCVR